MKVTEVITESHLNSSKEFKARFASFNRVWTCWQIVCYLNLTTAFPSVGRCEALKISFTHHRVASLVQAQLLSRNDIMVNVYTKSDNNEGVRLNWWRHLQRKTDRRCNKMRGMKQPKWCRCQFHERLNSLVEFRIKILRWLFSRIDTTFH